MGPAREDGRADKDFDWGGVVVGEALAAFLFRARDGKLQGLFGAA
jgi:hypothetical protein